MKNTYWTERKAREAKIKASKILLQQARYNDSVARNAVASVLPGYYVSQAGLGMFPINIPQSNGSTLVCNYLT